MEETRMTTLKQTERTTLRRQPRRASADPAVVDAILADTLVCHVAVALESGPVVQPMAFARVDDLVYVHGATRNRLLTAIRDGAEACLCFTLLDGLVLARSAFHHSMNYRSLVLFGHGREVSGPEEKRRALGALVDHATRGRSAETRAPSAGELDATLVLAFSIDEGSAKLRQGPAEDLQSDLQLPHWAGVVPLATTAGRLEPALPEQALPPSVERFALSRNGLRCGGEHEGGLELTTDPSRMDLERIHHFLAEESYWARGLTRQELVRAMQSSVCVGVFDGARQVAFCRLVTDFARHAWLGDVFVEPSHRGRGIARWMVRFLQERPELVGVWHWLLATRDAHGVYAERGFRPLPEPQRYMELRRPRPQSSGG
jgi:nitroimidazol reductase NimA-like FMN-containing flavoprotein (pyridoxamine 5'-phosphate oxidase superfamily)/GNAT superfamily N-acetyltransferase